MMAYSTDKPTNFPNGVSGLIVDESGSQVVGEQQSTIADPSGGVTQDAEARTAINAIIDALQAHGLIA